MESEQRTNTKNVLDITSSRNQVESNNTMAGDCKESAEIAVGDERATTVQQTEQSATTAATNPTLAEAARVELTDAKTGADVEYGAQIGVISEDNVVEIAAEPDDSEPVDENAGVPGSIQEAADVEPELLFANSEPVAKSADQFEECDSVEPVAQVIEDDDDEDEPQEIPDEEEEEMSENASEIATSEVEQVDEIPDDDDSQGSVDDEHDHEEDIYHSEVSQVDEEEILSADESQDDADEIEAVQEEQEEYDSNEDDEEEDDIRDHKMEAQDQDDDDDVVAVISDTSEEEDNRRDDDDEEEEEEEVEEDDDYVEEVNLKASERLYSDDECQSEMSDVEEDEDDLMNSAVMSRQTNDGRKDGGRKQVHKGSRREEKFRNAKVVKRHAAVLDWRQKIKKRSLKWLSASFGNPAMRNVYEPQHVNLIISNVTSASKKSHPSSNDSPSPYIPASKSPSETVDSESDTSKMQQINKISDCIKRSAQDDDCQEIKQQDNVQQTQQDGLVQIRKVDDNNKENIRSNVKNETSLAKINGTPTTADMKTSSRAVDSGETKDVVDIDESDEMDVMEISDEPSGEASTTIIERENSAKSSTCDIKSMPALLEAVVNVAEAKECEEMAAEKDIGPSEADTRFNNKETPQIRNVQSYEDHDHQSAAHLPKTNSPKQCADFIDKNTLTPPARPVSTNSSQVPAVVASEAASSQSEATAKRPRTDSRSDDNITLDDLHPTKKLKSQLDSNFSTHDQILNEYIEKTSNNSVDEIQKHLGQLIGEIHTLNDMIKAKELEWNNLLHLKKVKEEICLRLTRKKQVMEIMSTKVGQVNAAGAGGDMNLFGSCMENLNSHSQAIGNNKLLSNAIAAATRTTTTTSSFAESTPIAVSKSSSIFATVAVSSSTPTNLNPTTSMSNANVTAQLLNNLSNISAISVSGVGGGGVQQQSPTLNNSSGSSSNSIVQNILQNRANMKASDLNREKATTQRLHRILVSRNILPKPSVTPTAFLPSSPPTTAAHNGDASIHSIGLSLGKYPGGLTSTSLNAKTTISVVNSVASGGSSLLPMNLTNSNSMLAGQKGSVVAGNEQQPILNNYLTASALQKQIGEMLNGHHAFRDNCNSVTNGNQPLGVGRQGVFKDVRSIIADYRQKHPEAVPRRGRRVKSASSHGNAGDVTSNILSSVLKSDSKGSTDLGSLWHRMDGNSRPSSNDSSHSLTNAIASNMASGNVSFKDVLIQFAKLNEQNNNDRTSASVNLKSTNTAGPSSVSSPPFPEVTLHPVTTASSSVEQGGAGSLLHGILTKFNRQNSSSTTSTLVPNSTTPTTTTNYNSSFSPTLARLLTAPERITSATHSLLPSYHQQASSATGGNNSTSANQLNISKMVAGHNSEITITPVVSAQQVPTLLQQQLEQQHHQQQQLALKRDRIKLESLLNVKDDDSIDRLVIDEGGDSIGADDNPRMAPNACGLEFNENEVPACQGCKKNEAQFVCAGCANQLYCSRECQVAAWDEHSEVCTG